MLLDQFPRTLFRGWVDSFSSDTKAFKTATRAIARDFDKRVSVIQASAFYMPLMHQEDLVSFIAACCLFEKLKLRCVSEEEHKWADIGIVASKKHLKQLVKFGRKSYTILSSCNVTDSN